ncbi:unnamed protein product, partial [Closterium sp. NIES-54]
MAPPDAAAKPTASATAAAAAAATLTAQAAAKAAAKAASKASATAKAAASTAAAATDTATTFVRQRLHATYVWLLAVFAAIYHHPHVKKLLKADWSVIRDVITSCTASSSPSASSSDRASSSSSASAASALSPFPPFPPALRASLRAASSCLAPAFDATVKAVLLLAVTLVLAPLISSLLAVTLVPQAEAPHPTACRVVDYLEKPEAESRLHSLPVLYFIAGLETAGQGVFYTLFSELYEGLQQQRQQQQSAGDMAEPEAEWNQTELLLTRSAAQIVDMSLPGRKIYTECPRIEYSRQASDLAALISSKLAPLQ